MADHDDLKNHAINSSHDFYELLDLQPAASESEIRRAYRRTALKYHPDKVGPNDSAALEKFHLLQVAYDVLLDSGVRQLYDNARRAREEKKIREAAYGDRRKQLIEELEQREKAAELDRKRKRGEDEEENAFQRELKRLQADGARRRREREEQLRREYEEALKDEQNTEYDVPRQSATTNGASRETLVYGNGVDDVDRTITFWFPMNDSSSGIGPSALGREQFITYFNRFGEIEEVVVLGKTKKIKVTGEKHRREHTKAMVLFKTIVGAYSAVTDFPDLVESESLDDQCTPFWSLLKDVQWASGKEPDCLLEFSTPGQERTPHLHATDADRGSLPKMSTMRKDGKGRLSRDDWAMIRLKKAAKEQRSKDPKLIHQLNATAFDYSSLRTTPKLGSGEFIEVPKFSSFPGLGRSKLTRAPGQNGHGFGNPIVAESTKRRLTEAERQAERQRMTELLVKEDAEADAVETEAAKHEGN